MAERCLDLKGLKCPLPAMKTEAALREMTTDDVLVVECTDPMAAIDIPHLLRDAAAALEARSQVGRVLTFRIRKGNPTANSRQAGESGG